MCPYDFEFHTEYLDKIIGSSAVRLAIEKDIKISEIVKSYYPKLEEYIMLREEYLLY